MKRLSQFGTLRVHSTEILVRKTMMIFLFIVSFFIGGADAAPKGTTVCRPNQKVDSALIPFIRADTDPFCMNGGSCKSDFESMPDYPCVCYDGTTGPHCEFKSKNKVPKCNLKCFNDGVCQTGIRSYMDLSGFPADEDYNYCRCPPGFYGDQCELIGEQCGSGICLNGGKCIQIEHDDGTITDHCDCTKANRGNGEKFAGRFCHLTKTSDCSDHDAVDPSNFCVNGGTCHMDPRVGCECPEGFHGSLCEFGGDEENWECNMECGDHGFCRKGAKDTSFIENFDFSDRRLTARFNQEFEHCVCEPGWAGLNCDVKMDICPGRSMICLHGSSCALSNVTGKFECDCETATVDGHRYAGKYCQYHSTEYCTTDGKRPGMSSDAFCTNNGKCVDFVPRNGSHPGCECEEHFEGDHCEKLVNTTNKSSGPQEGENSSSRKGVMIAVWLLVFVFLAALAVFIWRRRGQQHTFNFQNDTRGGSGGFFDFINRKRNKKGKVAPFFPAMKAFKDDRMGSGDSLSKPGSENLYGNLTFEDDNTQSKDTRDIELPRIHSRNTSNSMELGGLRSDELRSVVKSDLSLYSFASASMSASKEMQDLSYSYSLPREQQDHFESVDLGEKNRRSTENIMDALNVTYTEDSSHLSSEIESMSSVDSKKESRQMVDSSISSQPALTQSGSSKNILSSGQSSSDEEGMEAGFFFESDPVFGTNPNIKQSSSQIAERSQPKVESLQYRGLNKSQTPKSVSFELEANKVNTVHPTRRKPKTRAQKVNPERSEHYRALGVKTPDTASTNHPWKEQSNQISKTMSQSMDRGSEHVSETSNDRNEPAKASEGTDVTNQRPSQSVESVKQPSMDNGILNSTAGTSFGETTYLSSPQNTDLKVQPTESNSLYDDDFSLRSVLTNDNKFSGRTRSKLIGRREKELNAATDTSFEVSEEQPRNNEKASTSTIKKSAKLKVKTKGKKGSEQSLVRTKSSGSQREEATKTEAKENAKVSEVVGNEIEQVPSKSVLTANGENDQTKPSNGAAAEETTTAADKKKGIIPPGFIISGDDESVKSKLTQIGLSSSWSSKSDHKIKPGDIFNDSSVSSISEQIALKANGTSSTKSNGGGLKKRAGTSARVRKLDPWDERVKSKASNKKKINGAPITSESLGASGSGSSESLMEAWEFAGQSKSMEFV